MVVAKGNNTKKFTLGSKSNKVLLDKKIHKLTSNSFSYLFRSLIVFIVGMYA